MGLYVFAHSPPLSECELRNSIACHSPHVTECECITEQTRGGGGPCTITEWTHPCALGVPHPVLGLPCRHQGKMSLNARDW